MHTPINIVFYTKPGCHLCEDVEELLEMLSTRHQLAVQAIDITRNPEIYSRYWSKVPVVQIGNTTLEAPIDGRALQAAVRQAEQEQR